MTKLLENHAPGDEFKGYLLVKSAQNGITVKGDPFISLTLGDPTGTVDAKIWDAKPADEEAFTSGVVVKIHGTLIDYQGTKQIRIVSIHPTDEHDNISAHQLLPQSNMPVEQSKAIIEQVLNIIQNPNIQIITKTIMMKYQNDFYQYPAAARVHHATSGGLAEHTATMLLNAEGIQRQYKDLNTDLLYAGIILHDICKVEEYKSIINPDITLKGQMLGHLNMMAIEISDTARTLGIDQNSEEVILLQHMALSHHGVPEWGSSTRPLLKEAQLLHFIDNIDAKMNTIGSVLNETEPGEFGEKHWALDGRRFYRPSI